MSINSSNVINKVIYKLKKKNIDQNFYELSKVLIDTYTNLLNNSEENIGLYLVTSDLIIKILTNYPIDMKEIFLNSIKDGDFKNIFNPHLIIEEMNSYSKNNIVYSSLIKSEMPIDLYANLLEFKDFDSYKFIQFFDNGFKLSNVNLFMPLIKIVNGGLLYAIYSNSEKKIYLRKFDYLFDSVYPNIRKVFHKNLFYDYEYNLAVYEFSLLIQQYFEHLEALMNVQEMSTEKSNVLLSIGNKIHNLINYNSENSHIMMAYKAALFKKLCMLEADYISYVKINDIEYSVASTPIFFKNKNSNYIKSISIISESSHSFYSDVFNFDAMDICYSANLKLNGIFHSEILRSIFNIFNSDIINSYRYFISKEVNIPDEIDNYLIDLENDFGLYSLDRDYKDLKLDFNKEELFHRHLCVYKKYTRNLDNNYNISELLK